MKNEVEFEQSLSRCSSITNRFLNPRMYTTTRPQLNRRYSDCKLVVLQDKEKKNPEDNRLGLLQRKDFMLEEFRKKYIKNERGILMPGVT